MKKSKAFFVTVLVAVMLAAILYGLHELQLKVFSILELLLAAYGLLMASGGFYRWLTKDAAMYPAYNYEEVDNGFNS